MLLKIFAIFTGKHLKTLKIDSKQVLSCAYFKIFKNTYFEKQIFWLFFYFSDLFAYRNSWTLDVRAGRWTLDAGLWTLGTGRWTLDAGLWMLDSGCWTLDTGLWTLDSGRWTLDAGLCTVDAELSTLGYGHWTLDCAC